MKYETTHLLRLQRELASRYDRIKREIAPTPNKLTPMPQYSPVDGIGIRLAVEDFKSILAEIKKLK